MTVVILTLKKKKHVLCTWKCGTLIDFRLSVWITAKVNSGLGCLQCGHGQHCWHFRGICCLHLQVLSILATQVPAYIYYRFTVYFERAIGRKPHLRQQGQWTMEVLKETNSPFKGHGVEQKPSATCFLWILWPVKGLFLMFQNFPGPVSLLAMTRHQVSLSPQVPFLYSKPIHIWKLTQPTDWPWRWKQHVSLKDISNTAHIHTSVNIQDLNQHKQCVC